MLGRDASGGGVEVGCNSICTRQFSLAIDLSKYTIVHPTFIYRNAFLQKNLQIVYYVALHRKLSRSHNEIVI